MTTNATIKTKIQKLVPGQLVELYTINLAPIGESITYNFCAGTMNNGDIVEFNSVEYTPLPVETEGWEQTGEGKLPRPKISLSNVTGVFQAPIIAYNDLVGCELTRRRTFYEFLDGGSTPDSNAVFPEDIYIIDKKIKHNKFLIQWELVSSIDIENLYIPRLQVLGTCTWRYRSYIDGAFNNASTNYSTEKDPEIQCPYQGTDYFTSSGVVTLSPSEDSCGKTLKACKLRFGEINPLPFGGFPNIKRFLKGR